MFLVKDDSKTQLGLIIRSAVRPEVQPHRLSRVYDNRPSPTTMVTLFRKNYTPDKHDSIESWKTGLYNSYTSFTKSTTTEDDSSLGDDDSDRGCTELSRDPNLSLWVEGLCTELEKVENALRVDQSIEQLWGEGLLHTDEDDSSVCSDEDTYSVCDDDDDSDYSQGDDDSSNASSLTCSCCSDHPIVWMEFHTGLSPVASVDVTLPVPFPRVRLEV